MFLAIWRGPPRAARKLHFSNSMRLTLVKRRVHHFPFECAQGGFCVEWLSCDSMASSAWLCR